MRSHTSLRLTLAALLVCVLSAAPTIAATIKIQFTGVDLVYDGEDIYDATDINGHNADSTEADPLTSVVFSLDNVVQGTLLSDIFLDLFIPDVTGIPATPGFHEVFTSGGFFDLLFDSDSPDSTQRLMLDLNTVNVTYLNASTFQFVFGASIADISNSNLPFGLQIGEPVEVSFSTNVSSSTTSGNFVTSFVASGTGEVSGPAIPEPSTGILAVLGVIAGLAASGWRRRR